MASTKDDIAHEDRKYVVAHERHAGSPCLKCGPEVCIGGLDLHFWRKICKTCKCGAADHDIKSDEDFTHQLILRDIQQLVTGPDGCGIVKDNIRKFRLASTGSEPDVFPKGNFLWVPSGVTKEVADKYMASLPEDKAPIKESDGEVYRRKQMMTQLPAHDNDERFCDALTDEEKERMRDFLQHRNEKAVGIGEVGELADTKETSKFKCEKCAEPLVPGDVAVFAARAGSDICWHPQCFVCKKCDELLVDLVYFFRENDIYCGRHYADFFRPRCDACDELIFSKSYTQAEGSNWHLKHFCCFECDMKLGGEQYVVRENPYCLACYEILFAKKCGTCGKVIAADDKRLCYKENFWHATDECFHCSNCSVSLVGKEFLPKGSNAYCSAKCYKEHRGQ